MSITRMLILASKKAHEAPLFVLCGLMRPLGAVRRGSPFALVIVRTTQVRQFLSSVCLLLDGRPASDLRASLSHPYFWQCDTREGYCFVYTVHTRVCRCSSMLRRYQDWFGGDRLSRQVPQAAHCSRWYFPAE